MAPAGGAPKTNGVRVKGSLSLRMRGFSAPSAAMTPPVGLVVAALPPSSIPQRKKITMSARSGNKHHNAKLTAAKVRAARKSYATGKKTIQALADKYGVRQQTMWSALKGKTWKDA